MISKLYFLTTENPIFLTLVLVIAIINYLFMKKRFKHHPKTKPGNEYLWLMPTLVLFTYLALSGLYLLTGYYRQKKACINQGGAIVFTGYIEGGLIHDLPYGCRLPNLPTQDAGKSCTDSSECESFCQPEENLTIENTMVGTCYGWKQWPNSGCVKMLRGGKVVVSQACSF